MPHVALRDVSAASGPDGARLCITIGEGSLEGLTVAFFLRGTTLDVSATPPSEEVAATLRSRESRVREALGTTGIEMGRFEMQDGDSGTHRQRTGPDEIDGPAAAPAARGPSSFGTGRDYVR